MWTVGGGTERKKMEPRPYLKTGRERERERERKVPQCNVENQELGLGWDGDATYHS
jgi:hypothetical protein